MNNVLTFSDLHGTSLPQIPKRFRNKDTIIILAGDICPNNVANFIPCIKIGNKIVEVTWRDTWNFRKIDIEAETIYQNNWLEAKLIPHLIKNNIDLNNVLALNGNHDWCQFPFPNSLRSGAKTISLHGIKIGMLTGVLPISGEWWDEINESEFDNRIHSIDRDIDVLISHSAPSGIKDGGFGSRELYKATMGIAFQEPHFNKMLYHIFGHSHNCHGVAKHKVENRIVRFYNTAQTRFSLDFNFNG